MSLTRTLSSRDKYYESFLKANSEVQGLIQQQVAGDGDSTSHLPRIKSLQELMISKQKTILSKNQDLDVLYDDNELDDQQMKTIDIEDDIMIHLRTVKDFLLSQQPSPTPVAGTSAREVLEHSAGRVGQSRLPKLNLPFFSGEILEWPTASSGTASMWRCTVTAA